MKLKCISLLIITVVFCLTATAQTKKADKVIETLERYDQAWNHKDAATVDKVLAAEYVYFSSTGSLTSRQKTLELLASPKYHLTSAERSEIKTFRAGDTVVVSSRWRGKGTYNDEPINDDQRCSLVFGKESKDWKLLSEHCTQIASK
jgi:ketosteroid isomerase-like protein